jgi:hypothetical protein
MANESIVRGSEGGPRRAGSAAASAAGSVHCRAVPTDGAVAANALWLGPGDASPLELGSAAFAVAVCPGADAACPDVRSALPTVWAGLRSPDVTAASCGSAAPAPKQASAPATVNADLRGHRLPRPFGGSLGALVNTEERPDLVLPPS